MGMPPFVCGSSLDFFANHRVVLCGSLSHIFTDPYRKAMQPERASEDIVIYMHYSYGDEARKMRSRRNRLRYALNRSLRVRRTTVGVML